MVCAAPYLPSETYHTLSNPSDSRMARTILHFMSRGVKEDYARWMAYDAHSLWRPLAPRHIDSREHQHAEEQVARWGTFMREQRRREYAFSLKKWEWVAVGEGDGSETAWCCHILASTTFLPLPLLPPPHPTSHPRVNMVCPGPDAYPIDPTLPAATTTAATPDWNATTAQILADLDATIAMVRQMVAAERYGSAGIQICEVPEAFRRRQRQKRWWQWRPW
ncbi:hypothetical protein Dda_8898 [Drechslerella dactyloides]|uniref:Uncharacterized protein n=1 Tax=Drechslerella dactyloides TaxID=74499 RepID=A0AAD6IQ40_DREDA|nr:hypothetical protein Dda_8898 [Drechslerella dactyloides]